MKHQGTVGTNQDTRSGLAAGTPGRRQWSPPRLNKMSGQNTYGKDYSDVESLTDLGPS
jgi:hypothetical protein